jgi:hypothetical protein
MRIVDEVNGRLTTSAMIQMNRDVDVDGQTRRSSLSDSSARLAWSRAAEAGDGSTIGWSVPFTL